MQNDNLKPHDAFMKGLLSDTERARTFLLTILPKELSAQLDLATLQPEDRSYVRDDLKEFFSDALFKVRLQGETDRTLVVSILLEHKSYPDKLVALQLLSYLTEGYRVQAGLDTSIRTQTESRDFEAGAFYPILPILFYHGSKNWMYKSFHQLFGKGYANLLKYIPAFDIIFFNLRTLSDADINTLQVAWLRAALMTQKYSHQPHALLERFVQIFEAINEHPDGNFFIQIVRYFISLASLSEGAFQELWKELPNNKNAASMNWLDEKLETAFQSGIEKGIEKGQKDEKKEIILRGIAQGYTLVQLAELTGFSEAEIQTIIQEN